MKVLLTGSSGFIGGALKGVLRAQGHEVHCLNRSKTGESQEILWDFISPLPPCLPGGIDALVHLAAKVSFSSEFDRLLYQINTVATNQLALWARQSQALFVFASTVGLHSRTAIVNGRTPVDPQSHYAMSKFIAEQQLKSMAADSLILRIGGVFGLDGPDHLGLNRAISSAYYQGQAPELAGNGEIRRNYICVDDLASWIVCLLEQWERSKTAFNGPVYMASTEVLSVRDYLQAITRTLTSAAAPIGREDRSGADFIIEIDRPPVTLTKFEDYLNLLSSRRRELDDGAQSQLQAVGLQP